jgi:sulfide:quinone oxidoreductase
MTGAANTPGGQMTSTRSHHPRILIAGGGVAALEAMLALRHLAGDLVHVEILSPEATFHYRPLDVGEPFGLGPVRRLELAELVQESGAGHRLGGLAAVDAAGKRVTTDTGEELDYDALIVAVGAAAQPALEGALTFWGEPDLGRFRELLADLGREPSRLAFVVPGGATWPLPLYEIAFLTAGHLAERGSRRTELLLVTHEAAPLDLFGPAASDAVGTLLERDGIKLHPGRYVTSYEDGTLRVVPSGEIPAERVVALPRLVGPELRGLPQDEDGFVPTDPYGRVRGLENVYAAGDVTTFPVKQGGLAAQQADAVAQSLAAWAGAAVDPKPFRPVLRGQLLTGGAPRFLRTDLAGGGGDRSDVAFEPLWWPPGKVAGTYLAPFLARHGIGDATGSPEREGIAVDVDLSERLSDA